MSHRVSHVSREFSTNKSHSKDLVQEEIHGRTFSSLSASRNLIFRFSSRLSKYVLSRS